MPATSNVAFGMAGDALRPRSSDVAGFDVTQALGRAGHLGEGLAATARRLRRTPGAGAGPRALFVTY